MQTKYKHHITHIDLSKQFEMPHLNEKHQNNYMVFWWKDIPLGQLFLNQLENFTETDYYTLVCQSIESTIEFYCKRQGLKLDDWKNFFINRDFEKLILWMTYLFADVSAKEVPSNVPVSVIICTRNRANDLYQCLLNIKGLACLPEEIIVVDNAPTDDSTLNVVKQFSGVTYVRESRPGLDIARNAGVKSATAPVIAFVDDDVLVEPLWVFKVWEAFREPATVAMTGLVIASELETEAQLLFETFWSFNRGYIEKVYDKKFFNSTLPFGPPVWEVGAGANMAFRRSIFEEVGYFDELLDVGAAGCNGDSEIWFRILLHGHTIHYNPRAVVFHKHRKDLAGLNKQLFYYMRGHAAAALIQKRLHQPAGYNRHIFWELPKWYLKLIVRGFPKYDFRYKLLKSEISGLGSGVIYYLKNNKKLAKV